MLIGLAGGDRGREVCSRGRPIKSHQGEKSHLQDALAFDDRSSNPPIINSQEHPLVLSSFSLDKKKECNEDEWRIQPFHIFMLSP